VREAAEAAQAGLAGAVVDAEVARGGEREEGVFRVVAAGELEQAPRVGVAVGEDEGAFGAVAADLGAFGGVDEDEAAALDRPLKVGGPRIVGVEQGEAVIAQADEDARLGVGVALHGLVAVDVVGGEVEDHRDVGGVDAALVHGLELEAGALEHERAGGLGARGEELAEGGAEGGAEVTADEGAQAARREQGAGEGGDGALAVGAGDEDGGERGPGVAGDREGEAHLAVDLGAGGELGGELAVGRGRDAGAEHDEIDAGEGGGGRGLLAEEGEGAVRGGRVGAAIVDVELTAVEAEQARGVAARRAEADDEGAAPRELGGVSWGDHRSLRVARPARASMKLMIQKRTTTLGSLQPLSSKWWWIGAILKTACR
jgi:hypothetical protein